VSGASAGTDRAGGSCSFAFLGAAGRTRDVSRNAHLILGDSNECIAEPAPQPSKEGWGLVLPWFARVWGGALAVCVRGRIGSRGSLSFCRILAF